MASDGAYFVKSNYVACVDKFHVLTFVVSAGGMSWFGSFLVFVLHVVREDLTFVAFNMMSSILCVVHLMETLSLRIRVRSTVIMSMI
jgi:hypothetical protein